MQVNNGIPADQLVWGPVAQEPGQQPQRELRRGR